MAMPLRRSESALARWARYASKHHWRVLGGWLVALVLIIGLVSAAGGTFVDSFTIPGAESQRAFDLLNERFPSQAGDTARIVVHSDAGVNDPAIKPRLDQLIADVSQLPEVVGVYSPFDDPGAISENGQYAYIQVQYDTTADEVNKKSVDALLKLVDASGGNGLQVEVGGQVVSAQEQAFGGS